MRAGPPCGTTRALSGEGFPLAVDSGHRGNPNFRGAVVFWVGYSTMLIGATPILTLTDKGPVLTRGG